MTSAPTPQFPHPAASYQPALALLGHWPADPQQLVALAAFAQQLKADILRWKSLSVTASGFATTMDAVNRAIHQLQNALHAVGPVEKMHIKLTGLQGICSLADLSTLQLQLAAHRTAITVAVQKHAVLSGATKLGLTAQNCHQLFVDGAAEYFDQQAGPSQKTRAVFKRFVDALGPLTGHTLPTLDSPEYKELFRSVLIQSWPTS